MGDLISNLSLISTKVNNLRMTQVGHLHATKSGTHSWWSNPENSVFHVKFPTSFPVKVQFKFSSRWIKIILAPKRPYSTLCALVPWKSISLADDQGLPLGIINSAITKRFRTKLLLGLQQQEIWPTFGAKCLTLTLGQVCYRRHQWTCLVVWFHLMLLLQS